MREVHEPTGDHNPDHQSKSLVVIGDSYGCVDKLIDDLAAGKKIKPMPPKAPVETVEWTGGNRIVVHVGDILAERFLTGIQVRRVLGCLESQVEDAGGRLVQLDGNHDNAAYNFLMGNWDEILNSLEEFIGITEFFAFASNENVRGIKTIDPLLKLVIECGGSLPDLSAEILGNMRRDPIGKALLVQMCRGKLVDVVGGTLITHTDPVKNILRYFNDRINGSVTDIVKAINLVYQTGRRRDLLGEKAPDDFVPKIYEQLKVDFLSTNNRSSKSNYSSLGENEWGPLRDRGIHTYVHGHTQTDMSKAVYYDASGMRIVNADLGYKGISVCTFNPHDPKSELFFADQNYRRAGL